MKYSVQIQTALLCLLASYASAVYNCSDLPNVYTKEDLDAIKVDCENAKVLGSTIYPSATWIINGTAEWVKTHGRYERYFKWLAPVRKPIAPWRELRRICIVTLGGQEGFGLQQREQFTNVSGNCGGSYPVDYASLYNFIDIGTKDHYYHDNNLKYPPHAMVENGEEVSSDEPNVLHISGSMDMTQQNIPDLDKLRKNVEEMHFPPTTSTDKQFICPAWDVTAENLNKCASIIGPIVYNGDFYGMDEITNIEDRPNHHGCFTVENVNSPDLSFLKDLKTKSDYVDRCIGKFANVVRNSPSLCPDPKTYYAYMDPDPESEIRTAFLNSEFNKKGEFYVKMEFPEEINYDCVNKCAGDITDADVTSPKGRYGYVCKMITGSVTLDDDKWKDAQRDPVLGEIREIIGKLTISAEVDEHVLPNLRTIRSGEDGPALELTVTVDDSLDASDTRTDEFESLIAMRLTKVTSNGKYSVLLKHSMEKDRIPLRLIQDLERITGNKDAIEFRRFELNENNNELGKKSSEPAENM